MPKVENISISVNHTKENSSRSVRTLWIRLKIRDNVAETIACFV